MAVDAIGGKRQFVITPEVLFLEITNFGGVGTGTNPSKSELAEVDTLQFVGDGFTSANLLLTQVGADLKLNFIGKQTEVILKGFELQNLDNLSNAKNIIFSAPGGFDVFNANWQESHPRVSSPNSVTFLNDLDNYVTGLNNSNDIINGQGGSDRLNGLSGNDTLRGGVGCEILTGGLGFDVLNGGEEYDYFVLEPNKGSDIVEDFTDGLDRFLLSGLTFAQLSIAPVESSTLISDSLTDQAIAFLNNVDSTLIGVEDFVWF